ncbi:ABC transporter substrate-binding protein [Acidovorax sp. HDW3]|uniref:ABC transporter substrate-binding protein n=1 Tax=Acidovorax sp. HDW3 TaxID=2714923 RepID=UPI0014095170|nr:ABC transporter substrate-binding protein [Acidovorax sp. HDW3]QIL44146.1 ABC transporter substrate-binding protein [Acidovorax sp. HDW3]
MWNKRQFIAGMGVAALAPWGLAQATPGVTDNEIVIGESLDLSGPLAQMAPDMQRAVQSYFEQINAQGGVHGRRLRLVTLDDGYRPEATAKNVTKLIEENNVFALCNVTGTANVAAILPLLAKESPPLPLISPFTGADLIREPAIDHVFNIRASYGDEIDKLVQHLSTVGVPRIAVLWTDNAFGKDGLAGAHDAMKKRGQKIHADAAIAPDLSNLQQAVQKLSASEPNSIIMVTAGAPTVAFIKAYRKINRGTRFYTLSVMGTQATLRALGEDGVGVVVTTVVPFPWSQSMPLAREYRQALEKNGFKDNVSFIGLEAYINAKVLVEGLRRAGKDLTRPRFIQAMESIKRLDIGGFEVDYGKGVRQGSKFVDLTYIGQGEKFTR